METNGPGGGDELDLERGSQAFTIIGVIGGLVSVILVLIQLREGNQIRKAENAQKLVEITTTHNMAFLTEPGLFSLSQKANGEHGDGEGYDHLTKEEKAKFKFSWVVYLNILENAYRQMRLGLIDEPIYESYDRDVRRNKLVLSKFWSSISELYSDDFKNYVTAIIEEGKSPLPKVGGVRSRAKVEGATPDSKKNAP